MTCVGLHSRIGMPKHKSCIGSIAALLLAILLSPQDSFAQTLPEAVHTTQSQFRIPFQFDADEMTRIGAVEVQLHVSTNQGGKWQLSQAVAPSAQKFQFDAPLNGEYWFSVRTIDLQRRPHPAGEFEAGLIVVVDDLVPLLTLDSSPAADGTVSIQWQATDDHLDVDSLRIEYLDSQIAAWQPIPVTPSPFGRTNWQPPAG